MNKRTSNNVQYVSNKKGTNKRLTGAFDNFQFKQTMYMRQARA